MTDIKIMEKVSPSTCPFKLPSIKLPHLIHYSRHFHKDRGSTKFSPHFKVLHSVKSNPREQFLKSYNTMDIVDMAKAYANKLTIPTINNTNSANTSQQQSHKSKLKKLKLHFEAPPIQEIRGKNKGKRQDKYWSPKYESDVLPTI